MALSDDQQAQVDALKPLIGDTTLDDDALYAILVAEGSLNLAAARVWAYKATDSADLIDVQEGSSRRPLSQLRVAALAMEAKFRSDAERDALGASAGRTTTRPIVRKTTLPS